MLLTLAHSQKSIPINTYDGRITDLTNGARVMYFFNTTTCQPISQTQDIDRPIIGGEVNFFLVTKTSKQAARQLIFNHDNYAFKNTKKSTSQKFANLNFFNKNIFQTFCGRPGFFANNTNDIKGGTCNWTSGHENKFWAREPVTPGQLNSYEKIRTMVVNGSPLRFAITLDGCQCSVLSNCGKGYIGGDVTGTKITTEGTIYFSKSMTLYFPVPTFPKYYRELLVGGIRSNNTTALTLSYLNATTWKTENDVKIACSIKPSRGNADFFCVG
ncbi:uncharacterized protein LOC128178118 [Crassostrea angulata]|uniref:uncharacterized protein LOC128178118 n=1 Tax=Magallana angulata TaxID=2784310 RepID=UPI0022B1FD57|nr:uncharacterized protein LOC128178118 [Crassostrea angulata]